jgi:hypothetical protein
MSEVLGTLKKFKDVSDKLAGSAYVMLLLWAGGLVVLIIYDSKSTGHVHVDLAEVLGVFGVIVPLTIALYRLGTFLDDWFFDPLFEPKTDATLRWLGLRMREARARAAFFLESGRTDWSWECKAQVEGIYGRAKKLFGEKTPQWQRHIKLPLEISKAARCFIIPLVLVFIYDRWPDFLPRLTVSDNLFRAYAFLANPAAEWLSIILAAVMCALYVKFRLDHMETLYTLVFSDSVFKQALTPIASSSESHEFSCEGCLIVIGRFRVAQIIRSDLRTFFDKVQKSFAESFHTLFSSELKWQSPGQQRTPD